MTEYSVNEGMQQALTDMLRDTAITELAPLRKANLVFLVAAMAKTDKDDQPVPTSGEPIVLRKVGPADAIFMEGHYKLYIDDFRWSEMDKRKQSAMLHRTLTSIVVETDKKGVKLSRRKPDVIAFLDNIDRYGAWEDPLVDMRERLEKAKEAAQRAKK